MTLKGVDSILVHWFMGIHLVFRTRHLGVNNQLWSKWPSPWGWPLWRIALSTLIVMPLLNNFRGMRLRMSHSHGWAPAADYEAMFGPRRLYLSRQGREPRSPRFDFSSAEKN